MTQIDLGFDWPFDPLAPSSFPLQLTSAQAINCPHVSSLQRTNLISIMSATLASATEAVKGAVSSVASTVTGAATTTTEPETVADETTTAEPDRSSVVHPASPQAKNLERKLSLRPDRSDLVDKNILKSTFATGRI